MAQVDKMQGELAEYACGERFGRLPDDVVAAAKLRLIDSLGALLAGFDGLPSVLARRLAARIGVGEDATIIGTRQRTTLEMAAFANATTARHIELNDFYRWPGSNGGHPSDMIPAILSAAEHASADGEELISAIVVAYEIYGSIADATLLPGFDYTNMVALGVAVAAGRLLGLSEAQVRHCIAICIVPNNALRQSREGDISMWKTCAAGQAGKAGIFSALVAREGFEGPYSPFEGSAGWFDHVARERFEIGPLGNDSEMYKILKSKIKPRACCGTTIPSVLAAERAHRQMDPNDAIDHVRVETYRRAKERKGTGDHHWNPTNRETADHSIPYVVAAALCDGTVGPRQFDDDHLASSALRAVMSVVDVVEEPAFTELYEQLPQMHRTRVTVTTASGKQYVGETGGEYGDLADFGSRGDIVHKFATIAGNHCSEAAVSDIVATLEDLEQVPDVRDIPPMFAFSEPS